MRYPHQLFFKASADNNLLSHFLSLIRAGKKLKFYNGFVLMARRTKIYEGKAKIIYEGPEPGTIVQYFKDDATAFNAEKKEVIDEANKIYDFEEVITSIYLVNDLSRNKL